MANTANADKCEIVCGSIEVDKQLNVEKNGRFSIENGENEQEIKLTPGKLTEKFVNAENYTRALDKQKSYKTKKVSKDVKSNGEER